MVKSSCFSQFKLFSKEFELIYDIHIISNLGYGIYCSMYYGLILAGYYLPAISSAAITSDYLYQVATNKCFRIDAKQMMFEQALRPISKEEIIYEIKKNLNNKSKGFTDSNLPDKAWAINILKTLELKHELFLNPKLQEDSGLPQDDLVAIQRLDTSIGRNKRFRYFRRTKEQVKKMKHNEENKKEIRKQRIKAKKLLKIQKLVKEVEELESPLIEEHQN